MEEWRSIPGYPERFQVSSEGRLRVVDYTYDQPLRNGKVIKVFKKGRVVKQLQNSVAGGYMQATFTYTEDGVRSVWAVKPHRCVALAFIPNPKNLREVNHKDSDKLNNCVENLEWVTRSENMKHNYASGYRKVHCKKLPIVGFNGTESIEFDSLLSAHKSGRFQMASIQRCLVGKAKHHKGFTWKHKTEQA